MPKPWYKVEARINEPNAAAEIFIYGNIGEDPFEETIAAKDFVRELASLRDRDLLFHMNSIGGSVPDGLAIYNAIKSHPKPTRMVIEGVAGSISSYIAVAANEVITTENGLWVLHGAHGGMLGMYNAKELRDRAGQLDIWTGIMAEGYAAKTGSSREDMVALLSDGVDHFFDAAQAKAFGLTDEIVEAIPLAASAKLPSDIAARYHLPQTAQDFFVEPAAPAAQSQEAKAMTEKQRQEAIRAKFKPHAKVEGMDKLLDECLADENITAEIADEKIQAKLDSIKPPQSQQQQAPQAQGADADAIKAQAKAEENQRQQEIRDTFKPYAKVSGMTDIMEACLKDTGISAEKAGLKILAKLGEGTTPVAGHHISVGPNESRVKFHNEVVGCIIARAGKADAELQASVRKSPHRHLTLIEMAKASLSRAGIDHSYMDPIQVARAALTQTTSDFPILLENAMHKEMLRMYTVTADTWSKVCKKGSVSDFRAHNRYRRGSLGSYLVKNEAGEYVNVAIPDGLKESITIDDRGMIINLTFEAIVNDDMGSFMDAAGDLGRSGKLTIEKAFYASLLDNSGLGPTMADGNALFHTAHKNINATGSALSAAGIDADSVVMGSQTDINGNEILDLKPSILLLPLSLRSQGIIINKDTYDPDASTKQLKTNPVQGMFSDVIGTARLTGTRRYLFADPTEAPVFEVAFLNGESEPRVEMENSFSSRGVRWRGTLPFGVDAIAWEGGVTNAGG